MHGKAVAAQGSASFGHLPMFFETNQGQAGPEVRFLARGRDHVIALTSSGATLALRDDDARATRAGTSETMARRTAAPATRQPARVTALEITFPGANPDPSWHGLEPTGSRLNYLVGRSSGQWLRNIPAFNRIRCQQLYRGIDLIYYGNDQRLEFDFVVAAGADASLIAIRFHGAEGVELDSRGDLMVRGGPSRLRQHRPVAYQLVQGARREVAAGYVLRDRLTVGLALGRYDASQPLIIDPVLSYSTFLGGNRGDVAWAIAVDAAGSAYVAGDTLSVFKKLPLSGFQTNFGGGSRFGGDAFVAKLDPTGTNLVYLTYLGGDGLDGAAGLAVDSAGNAYVTGYTDSTNFPTAGAAGVLQSALSGTNEPAFKAFHSDAFVAKLDPSGSDLVYSSYLGGEQHDTGLDIAVDAAGAAYVVGFTESALTYQTTNRVCTDVYTKVVTNVVVGTNTVSSTNTVAGTSRCVTNMAIVRLLVTNQVVTNAVAPSRQARRRGVIEEFHVVTTTLLTATQVTSGLAVTNAIQTNNAGLQDLFVAKITPNGSQLEYLTYLGGHLNDFGTGIGVDGAGNAIVCGYSESVDFPVTNAIQAEFGGIRDGVMAKLDAAGTNLLYSTFLGGQQSDAAYRVAVDGAGNAYVTGATASFDFPTTPGSLNRGGVFLSTDQGGSWSLVSSGLAHTVITTLAADPSDPNVLYAGTPRGVFKTVDGGTSWVLRHAGLPFSVSISFVTLHPTNSARVFAGTGATLFRSDDAAGTWTNSSSGLGSAFVRSMVFDPVQPSTVYAGTASGVYKSLENGTTNWFPLNKGLGNRSVNALVLDPVNSSLLYAATDGGIYVSTNSATNWRSRNTGLASSRALAIAVDPLQPQTLYAGTARGFHRSVNGGTNWTQLTNGLGRPWVTSILIDPVQTSTLWAGTTNGLFKSLDSGDSWVASQTNLTSLNVAVLVFGPGPGGPIFAATRGTNFAGGTNDVFLAKLVPDGSAFAYACTFGGTRNDEARDVAIDAAGNAYVTGLTASRNFPVVSPSVATQTNNAGRSDVFVTAFDPTGASNLFSIYLGGRGNDFGNAIAVDGAGGVYVVGQTESSQFVITNALQPIFGAGGRDAFVLKLVPDPGPFRPPPLLRVMRVGDRLLLQWPVSSQDYVLESCAGSFRQWTAVTSSPIRQNGVNSVTLPASANSCFFRLRTRP